ncbi:MAG: hypothetical protein HY744_24570 [Deltaproteobacteria bacterium]|nr:hypothetical protein [Deltaproteobacteria bacterium]
MSPERDRSPRPRRRAWRRRLGWGALVAIVVVGGALGVWAIGGAAPRCKAVPGGQAPDAATSGRRSAPGAEAAALRPLPPAMPRSVSWIAFGGGAEPASNQVSLEQDLGLAARVLGATGPGVLLFAGGMGAAPVQELGRPPPGDPLLATLGELLDPRDGREAHYRPTALHPHGPATAPSVLAAVESALAQRGAGPLVVFAAAHGQQGNSPREGALLLWGGAELSVAELAGRLDAAPGARPLQLVVAACFSGGFADLAFAQADPDKGAAPGERCGLFASTWDREASGCDPNPERSRQESYALHFLNALRGADRDGRALALAALDLDGDGRISLLEAHTRARIASRSIGVPTATSERWLRRTAPRRGPGRPLGLPEEDAVIAALGRQLAAPDGAAARGIERQLAARLEGAQQAAAELEDRLDERQAALRTALLERWPELGDPWHPDFAATLARERKAVAAFLARSPLARAYEQAKRLADEAGAPLDALEAEISLAHRLVRAHETRTLAARLNARPGQELRRYLALLACERTVPGKR